MYYNQLDLILILPFLYLQVIDQQNFVLLLDLNQHLNTAREKAADIEVVGVDNKELAEWIRDNLEFDQLILEFYRDGEPDSGWIHVSWNSDNNRSQTLKALRNEDGKVEYRPW
jgi:hypothetical protein